MKEQKHIYLSLGSNLGNKFEQLQQAVNYIFDEIGSIDKISSVYETPALGFDGANFLNCVVSVRATLSPQNTLKKVLEIERKMGRERTETETYVSRSIDIDILFIEDEVIDTKKLTVPHPEMAHRKFVLQPMAEVNAQFIHPQLQKNMVWMLAKTKDPSTIHKLSKWLRNPKKDFDISKYNYIAVEGNIGAGKTSFATLMAKDFNAKLILERFKDNPFLPKFYKDQARYAFPLEMSFLADRYQQLVDDITQFDLFKECVIADYDAYKSLIFAQVTLAEEEFTLYKKLFHLMHKELPKPDVYVYLYQTTDRLLENIKKRGRSYEQQIPSEYLEKINQGYLDYIKNQQSSEVILIDISELDFIKNRSDYLTMLRQILR